MLGRGPIVQAREGELAALGAQRCGIQQGPLGACERRVLCLGQEALGTVVIAVFDRCVRLILDRLHVRAVRAQAGDLREQRLLPLGNLAELGRQILDRHVLLAERAQEGRHRTLRHPELGREIDDLRRPGPGLGHDAIYQFAHLLGREPDRDGAVPDVAASGDAVLGGDALGRLGERRP
jgi:hypothetical protein